ncbi:MAG: YukJ family protein [Bryobacteraceae bacterium]
MAKQTMLYGVLKGTVSGHLRNADDDHYQILLSAGNTMYRIAVNVQSSLKPPDLLFQSLTSIPASLTKELTGLPPGFKKLASKRGGLAQDFVRGGLIKPDKFKVVPGDIPGVDNDLKDSMEDAVVAAMSEAGTFLYAFGAKWGPETKKDQYFKFTPGNGIHDIHMNQGNDKSHAGDDGVFHDGCLIFQHPGGKYRAFFLAFQSQSFHTDDKTGHAIPAAKPPGKMTRTKSGSKTRAASSH